MDEDPAFLEAYQPGTERIREHGNKLKDYHSYIREAWKNVDDWQYTVDAIDDKREQRRIRNMIAAQKTRLFIRMRQEVD